MAQEVVTSRPLTARGTSLCRGCDAESLVSVLDLGDQPLANEMAAAQDSVESAFPLHLRICSRCGLGQVGEYVLPERIFGHDYPYLSSMSSTWVEHAARYATAMQDHLDLTSEDLVVEVASNDGYLLDQVQAMGMRVLGVEPAGNVADIARDLGVPTLSEFFGRDLARRIVAEHGHPRLVTANNVMAHVPDLHDFVGGLAELCDDHTVITVENPSFLNLLHGAQFDTIYHEHFSYLTAHAVRIVAESFGLGVDRVDALATHGGSNRYWLSRQSSPYRSHASVEQTIDAEVAGGLLNPQLWERFARRSTETVEGLRSWVDEQHRDGRKIVAYGAAAKGNTLLNAAGVTSDDVLMVVDESPAKQGTFLPGSRIPVRAPSELSSSNAESVLILPWNIAAEVRPIIAALAPEAECWTAVPEMRPIPLTSPA